MAIRRGRGEGWLGVCISTIAGVMLAAGAAAENPAPGRSALEREWLRQAPLLARDAFRRQAVVDEVSSGAVPPEVDAAGVVDGHKDGKWGNHTDQEADPWWQVDLEQRVPLVRIVIFNRCDTPSRSRQLEVLVSDDASSWHKAYQHDDRPFYGVKGGPPLTVPLGGKAARYVRIRIPGNTWLHLDEVEVYGAGDPSANLALGRPATQSSTSQWSAPPHGEGVARNAAHQERECSAALPAAIDLAKRTLQFVGDESRQPRWLEELKSLETRALAIQGEPCDQSTEIYLAVRRLRREMILAHPALDFSRLLINKRPPPGFSHQSDQYLGRHSGLGDGLVVLNDWKSPAPEEHVLLADKLPPGSVLHPDLSYDARRIVFSYCNHADEPRKEYRRFFLWEIDVDGTNLRQLTGTARDPLQGREGRETVLIEDFDPCYLPDGRIAFVSTRNQGGVRCHHGGRYCPTYTLYRCDGDGNDIVPMVHGEANEWDPSVLPDGRILWTRWDYINRHDTVYQSLWTIHPNGTQTAHYYGNYTRNPCAIFEGRAVPHSHRVVATAGAHHSYTTGSIILVDPHRGQDGPEPLERVTPEIAFPETEAWPDATSATPWPLSEDLFLAAYATQKQRRQGQVQQANAFAIFLIDTLGGRELIYWDDEVSCFAPIPLVPRPEPPVLPSNLPEGLKVAGPEAKGKFYIQDVYHSSAEIPADSIEKVRVVRIYEQPAQRVPDRSHTLFELPKEIVGTADVEEDGSVAFEAPAGVPLLFQLVDENDMAVMSMRSFVYLQEGESATCAGCHEPRHTSPTARAPFPDTVAIQSLRRPPEVDYDGGLTFARTVQPVLDRYCIECHGLDATEGGVNLVGSMRSDELKLGRIQGSTAYDCLVADPERVVIAMRNEETPYSEPKDYFSHAGRLGPMLRDGDEHHDSLAKRDPAAFRRIVYWLDLNAQFFGDYSWNKDEWRQVDQAAAEALREEIRSQFGDKLAAQPLASLVNNCDLDQSRVLMGPLDPVAGGWGTIEPRIASRDDARWRKLHRLAAETYQPRAGHDVLGGCNLVPCECKSCWVRQARAEYRATCAAKEMAVTAEETPLAESMAR